MADRLLSVPQKLKVAAAKALALYVSALLAALAFGSFAQAQAQVQVQVTGTAQVSTASPQTVEPPLPEAASPMSFARACEAGQTLTIAAVGDILPHEGLAQQAYASKIGFESLWIKVVPYLQAADMAYANIEGPVAQGVASGGELAADPGPTLNRFVYTGTSFLFNYHPRIIDDLKTSGFNIVSVANNHALDRSSVGVDRTVQNMIDHGIQYSGAHRSQDPQASISTIVARNGFRVAWIACTDVYNGPDPKHLVTACADEATIISEIQKLGRDSSIDAVIIAPHWGEEYHHIATSRQRMKARHFLDAGAAAIIGSHPHMLEEMETYRTADGRDTVIAYSLGNFVSGQGSRPGLKATVMMFLGLTKRPGEKAWVNGVSYLPLWMDRGPHSINAAESSTQAPHATVNTIISHLMDPSRSIKASLPIKTKIGCP